MSNESEPYAATHDASGVPIADLSTEEIKRRLAIMRRLGAASMIERQYRRGYENALRERGQTT